MLPRLVAYTINDSTIPNGGRLILAQGVTCCVYGKPKQQKRFMAVH